MTSHIEECIQLERSFQSSMGYPKFIKKIPPLRPIVSSIGSVSYGASKEIAKNHQATGWIFRTSCKQLKRIHRRNEENEA